MPAGDYQFTVGVKDDPFDKSADPKIVALEDAVFDARENDTQILFDANTRAMRACPIAPAHMAQGSRVT